MCIYIYAVTGIYMIIYIYIAYKCIYNEMG